MMCTGRIFFFMGEKVLILLNNIKTHRSLELNSNIKWLGVKK
jgi:hypothetical protein